MEEVKPYRRIEEIDSLRAIAVLGVLANHSVGLKGGFIGVDIFFVISGYVITLLLINQSLKGNFNFSSFYHHRIARIIPPLFVVSLFIYLCMKLLFWLPEDYDFVRQSFCYQAFFAQNFFFAERTADYFHGLSTAKLNLHFWSLAVEEQFYIFYPFVFALAFKFRNARWMHCIIILLFAISIILIGSLFESTISSSIVKWMNLPHKDISLQGVRYYLLPARVWELFLGAVACVFTIKKQTKINGIPNSFVKLICLFCLAVILMSMFAIEETMAWPSFITIIPLIVTSLLLAIVTVFGNKALPLLLGNRIILAIGRSSYSLYLWHWPLMAVLIYTNSDFGKSIFDYIVYFLLVFIFTILTYWFVERNRSYISRNGSFVILFLFIYFSLFASNDTRSINEMPGEIRTILETGAYAEECKSCVTKPSGRFIILWGDSHSQMLVKTLSEVCHENGVELIYIRESLNEDHAKLFALAKDDGFVGAILASRWSMYALGFPVDEPEEIGDRFLSLDGRKAENQAEAVKYFRLHLDRLLAGFSDKPILIFKEVPRYSFMPKKEAIMEFWGAKLRPLPEKTIEKHRDEQKMMEVIFCEAVSYHRNIELFDPTIVLCTNGICAWREGRSLLYKDDDHLSVFGVEKFHTSFSNIISNWCTQRVYVDDFTLQ
jgi:peptidoglycan/LPS O-acetylase OafA/YrhL